MATYIMSNLVFRTLICSSAACGKQPEFTLSPSQRKMFIRENTSRRRSLVVLQVMLKTEDSFYRQNKAWLFLSVSDLRKHFN